MIFDVRINILDKNIIEAKIDSIYGISMCKTSNLLDCMDYIKEYIKNELDRKNKSKEAGQNKD